MRALVIFLRLAPFVLAFVWDRRRFLVVGGPRRPDDARHRRRAERLTRTVAELGPTFIKLAQVFAARADIVPEPYLGAGGTCPRTRPWAPSARWPTGSRRCPTASPKAWCEPSWATTSAGSSTVSIP